MVVDQIEDLDHGAVRQGPGGDVRLPALVGQLTFKADQRAMRALLSLGHDQALTPQDAPDSREGGGVSNVLTQVVGDRLRARVVALS